MSVLQNRAKPVIVRLLEQPTDMLDDRDCKALAIWAVMTCMVLEALNEPETWRFTDSERDLLFKKRNQVPTFTFVWIANWVNSTGQYYVSHLLERRDCQVAVTTIAFGTVAFQVLKVVPRDATSGIPMLQRPGPWERAAFPVWPPLQAALCWPPPIPIASDAGLEAFELRFSFTVPDSKDPSDQV